MKIGVLITKKAVKITALSEWRDSNARPLAPHARMLANCTTPRFLNWTAKVILFVRMAMIFLKNFYAIFNEQIESEISSLYVPPSTNGRLSSM